jgi:hypothetical protein
MKKDIIYLHHSPLLFIPILGELTYLLQTILFRNNLIMNIYISNKKQKMRELLINSIGDKKIIFCRSYKFGTFLKNFSSDLVFDDTGVNLKLMNKDDLRSLMWALVFCKSITKESRAVLKGFIPQDYPIY